MNFIDISSWQSGINLPTVFEKNPVLDGVIVKATEGTYYMNPDAEKWIGQLQSMSKPFGFYHFMTTEDINSQMDFFIKKCKNLFGKGIAVLDYEADALKLGTGKLKEALDRVFSKTGVRPLVYCSLSVVQSQDFTSIAADGYDLWLAQYADMKFTYFKDEPWQSGSVSPFKKYWMHQYSSCGRIYGYGGNIDLDKFYGTEDDWNGLAHSWPVDDDSRISKPVTPELIERVLDGFYGNGAARKSKLHKEGYDYDAVQAKINELYNIAGKIKMEYSSNKDYMDLIVRIAFKG